MPWEESKLQLKTLAYSLGHYTMNSYLLQICNSMQANRLLTHIPLKLISCKKTNHLSNLVFYVLEFHESKQPTFPSINTCVFEFNRKTKNDNDFFLYILISCK